MFSFSKITLIATVAFSALVSARPLDLPVVGDVSDVPVVGGVVDTAVSTVGGLAAAKRFASAGCGNAVCI